MFDFPCFTFFRLFRLRPADNPFVRLPRRTRRGGVARTHQSSIR